MLKGPIISMQLKPWYKKSVQAWNSDLIYITFLFLSACIYFRAVLLHPDQLRYFIDEVTQFYPWGFFAQTMLKEGQLPLWLPYSFGGEPFIANIQTAVFYPPNLILLSVFPTHLALGYGYLLHLFLAGFFMYLFMRYLKLDSVCSFLSSIIFMYNGFFVAHIKEGHYSMIAAACWLPLIFLFFEITLKKTSVFYGLVTGIPIGLQFLAGHTHTSYYTLLALGLYLVFRSLLIIKEKRAYKEVAQLFAISALTVGVGVFLAAIQLLPTFEFTGLSTRAGGIRYDFATIYSLPRQNLITLVLPNFTNNQMYIGILPLILIFFAIFLKRSEKEERNEILFFTGLAILSLFLAFGDYARIYWWVWKYIPGFNLFRFPYRFLFLFTFSTAILAGFGFRSLNEELTLHNRQKVWKVIKLLVLLITLVVCEILIFKDELIFQGHINRRSLRLLASIITQPVDRIRYYITIGSFPLIFDLFILMALSLGSVTLLTLRIKPYYPFKFKSFNKCFNILKKNLNPIVILFVLSNLWFFHIGGIFTRNPSDIYSEPDDIVFLKNNSGIYRVYDSYSGHPWDSRIPDNYQIIYGIHELSTYNQLKLKAYEEVLSCIRDLENNANHPILNLLNVKYILTATPLDNSGFELVFNTTDTYIYENKQVLPKAFVLYKVKILSEDDVKKELRRASFNPLDAVLLEQTPNIEPLGTELESHNGVETAEIRKYSPHEIIVGVTITQPGFLVLSENYYPGWKVYVDGTQQEIHKAYHTLRAVYLDVGLHKVQFTYDSTSLWIGSWITFLTSLFLVGTISMKRMMHLKLLRESQ